VQHVERVRSEFITRSQITLVMRVDALVEDERNNMRSTTYVVLIIINKEYTTQVV
jgi:hypothetical protein